MHLAKRTQASASHTVSAALCAALLAISAASAQTEQRSKPSGIPDGEQAMVIKDLPMQAPPKTGCPPLGVAFDRNSAQNVTFVRVMSESLDKACRNIHHDPQPTLLRGAPRGFYSIKFSSCNGDPRGAAHGMVARGDVTCAH